MNKKAISTILVLILLTSMMVSVFLGTLEMAKASGQISSDSNGDPNSWLMFLNDLSHSGYSSSTVPMTGAPLWMYPTGEVVSSPAVAGGIVYIGSYDGNVYALNAANGAYIWNYTTGGVVLSSPAVAGGIVYIGSTDGNVYALNATTGHEVWIYPTEGPVGLSSPAVANGIVYIGSTDGNVYALNATTGHEVWIYPTGGPVSSSPAVAGNTVYVGSFDGYLYALNAVTGQKTWDYQTGNLLNLSPVGALASSSPAVANGIVYIGSTDGNVTALNAATGTFSWNYTTDYPVISSPAVANGTVYIGLMDGNVTALNAATGTFSWSYTTSEPVLASPAVAGGTVCIDSFDGNMYALNAVSGTKMWSYSTGGSVISSPAVANGIVYIGSTDGNMYAFSSLESTRAVSSTSVSCSPNPAVAGSPVTCTATVSGSNPIGTVTWSTNSSTGSFSSIITSGVSISAPLISGTSTVTYTNTSPGAVNITATYNGDTNNAPSNDTALLTMSGFVVSGYVLAPNGMGVANAGVGLGNNNWSTGTSTDESGYYSLAVPLPGGTYNFNVNPPSGSGFVNYQTSLDVTGNMVMNVTLQRGLVVSGYVLAPNGMGVANAGVFMGNNTGWGTGTQTDTSGYYSLAVPPGTYNFNVNVPSGSGFVNYQTSLDVTGNLVWNVTLSSGYVVSGYVLAPNGMGVANVGVNLGNNTWNTGIQTDESGYYSLAVPAGTYNFNVNVPPGSAFLNYQTSLDVTGNMVMNVTLSRGFIVSGYVLGPNGMGVANAGVSLGSDSVWYNGGTNESGYYSLAVPAGTYNFNAGAPSGSNLVTYHASNVVVDENMVMNVTLQSGFLVSGYVFAPNGAPVANAQVGLENNTWSTGTQTDTSGYYSLAAPAGTYNFNVNPPSGSGLVNYQEFNVVVNENMVMNVTMSNGSTLAAPTISASVGTVDQGQTSILTMTAPASGGHPSYTYQWFEVAPNGTSYMVGSSSNPFSFVTSGATATGSWSFILQVTDNTGAAVNSTAASVTVNSALAASTVTPTPATVDKGQTSSLTSSAVTTGTPSYSYQWFEMTPGGSYVMVGSDSASFSFVTSGSTTTGSWSFILQVTDNTGAAVNSTAVSVLVDSALGTPVVTPTPGTVDKGQTSSLTSTDVTATGTTPFQYQWFEMTPGGSYVMVGSNSTSFSFVTTGSTATGVWSFELQVTDSTGASVTSTAATVTVDSALAAPTVTATPTTVDQGQTSSLTSTTVSTGTAPYTYVWMAEAPGGTYVAVGTDSPSYSFVTSGLTTLGTWSFELVVIDSTGTLVPSNVVTVLVDPALTAPSVTPAPATVDQGQTSVLSSSAVTTGSGGYTYEWFAKVGAGSYSLIGGATLSSYNFVTSTSTATGTWSFILQVTDSTGAAVNSTAATVTVSQLMITVTQGANGVIAPGTTAVNYGGSQSFTITPNTGYYIASLTVDGSSVAVASSYTFSNVVASHTITATFALTSTPTPAPTAAPTPTPAPSPSPTPSATTVQATTTSGATVDLPISGNITSSQMSNITIATNQSTKSTTLSFTVTGKSGTTGFGNITIPKSAVPYGTTPTIYIDGQPATNQGYTQDTNNYYVWYTIHFSTHQVSIVFTTTSPSPSPTPQPILPIGVIYGVAAAVVIVAIVAVLLVFRKSKKGKS